MIRKNSYDLTRIGKTANAVARQIAIVAMIPQYWNIVSHFEDPDDRRAWL